MFLMLKATKAKLARGRVHDNLLIFIVFSDCKNNAYVSLRNNTQSSLPKANERAK